MKSETLGSNIWTWNLPHSLILWIEPTISSAIIDKLEKNSSNWKALMEERFSELDKHIYKYIHMYYNLVDSNDIETYRILYLLYSEKIQYDRCDLSIKWKDNFIDFFEERFNNLKIKHNIEEVIPFNNKVYVKWTFFWKNIRLDKHISWDFVDVHTFSTEENINERKIIKRRTYLSDKTLKKYYDNFQLNLIKDNDIVEIKVLKKTDREILINFNCSSNDKKNKYIKHKFIRMWYWIEVVEWINSEWKKVNTILLVDLKTWWKEDYYTSNMWSELIK